MSLPEPRGRKAVTLQQGQLHFQTSPSSPRNPDDPSRGKGRGHVQEKGCGMYLKDVCPC